METHQKAGIREHRRSETASSKKYDPGQFFLWTLILQCHLPWEVLEKEPKASAVKKQLPALTLKQQRKPSPVWTTTANEPTNSILPIIFKPKQEKRALKPSAFELKRGVSATKKHNHLHEFAKMPSQCWRKRFYYRLEKECLLPKNTIALAVQQTGNTR